eukprot:8235542-Lingulodinium_polyedra.AAC.1
MIPRLTTAVSLRWIASDWLTKRSIAHTRALEWALAMPMTPPLTSGLYCPFPRGGGWSLPVICSQLGGSVRVG